MLVLAVAKEINCHYGLQPPYSFGWCRSIFPNYIHNMRCNKLFYDTQNNSSNLSVSSLQVSSFLKMLGPFFKPRWPYSPYQRSYTLEILHVYSCGKYFRFIRGDFSNSDPKLIFPGVLVQPPGVKNLEIFFFDFFIFFDGIALVMVFNDRKTQK